MWSIIATFDAYWLEHLYALRDPQLVQYMIYLAELGKVTNVVTLALFVAALLVWYKHYAFALGLFIATASSIILNVLIKGLVARERPDLLFQAYPEIWHSFPSTHAMLSAAFYGFCIYLAWRLVLNRAGRYIAFSVLTVIILLVSFGRAYLGVHYATDVIVGLTLGALSAWFGILWVRFNRV